MHVLSQRTCCVKDLWVAVEDVKLYEADRLLIEGHLTKTEHSHKQLTPSQQEDLTSSSEVQCLNQKQLLAFFAPAVLNTIKSWALDFGIPKTEPGNKLKITLKDATDIKTQHADYYQTKKSKNKF